MIKPTMDLKDKLVSFKSELTGAILEAHTFMWIAEPVNKWYGSRWEGLKDSGRYVTCLIAEEQIVSVKDII